MPMRGPEGEPENHPKVARRSVGSHENPTDSAFESQDVFLLGMAGVSFTQLESRIGRTRQVRTVQLDGTNRSHNLSPFVHPGPTVLYSLTLARF